MKLEHRCFKGESFRPTPEVLIHEDLRFFAILTPWGPASYSQKLLDFLIQNHENFKSDEEKTSVYPQLESLSREENVLRTLILSCNEWVFKNQNEGKEYNFGYELVCGNFINGKVVFLQIGQPHIYLDRPEIPLQPLGHILDLSGAFSRKEKRLPPLPSSLLGLHPDTHFSVFSFPVEKEDRLLFISRDFASALNGKREKKPQNLESFMSLLTEENSKSPLWIGLLSF